MNRSTTIMKEMMFLLTLFMYNMCNIYIVPVTYELIIYE